MSSPSVGEDLNVVEQAGFGLLETVKLVSPILAHFDESHSKKLNRFVQEV